MQSPLGLDVGRVREFGCGEMSYVRIFPGNPNPSSPFAMIQANTEQPTAFVGNHCYSHVLHIRAYIAVSQIAESVIRRIAVYVVNVFGRPRSVNVQPRQPMSFVRLACNNDVAISKFSKAASNSPNLVTCTTANSSKARKSACIWVVVKQFAQALRSKIKLIHDALLMLIGQRPVSVFSTARASLF
jgi:hypothetical protein